MDKKVEVIRKDGYSSISIESPDFIGDLNRLLTDNVESFSLSGIPRINNMENIVSYTDIISTLKFNKTEDLFDRLMLLGNSNISNIKIRTRIYTNHCSINEYQLLNSFISSITETEYWLKVEIKSNRYAIQIL